MLAAVTVVVSLLLAYVGWNALRAPRIDGFQGRYLLLVLAIVALVVHPDSPAARPRAGVLQYVGGRVREAGLVLVGFSGLMLLAVEIGLAWHSYH